MLPERMLYTIWLDIIHALSLLVIYYSIHLRLHADTFAAVAPLLFCLHCFYRVRFAFFTSSLLLRWVTHLVREELDSRVLMYPA